MSQFHFGKSTCKGSVRSSDNNRGLASSTESIMRFDWSADCLLKVGWEQETTPSGEVYYVNLDTKVTRWDRPVASPPENSSSTTYTVPDPAPSIVKRE